MPSHLSTTAAPRPLALAMATGLVALLAACSTTKLDEPTSTAPVESRTATAPGAAGTAGAGGAGGGTRAPQSSVATVDLNKPGGSDASALAGQRIIYFDFDSYIIKDEFKGLVDSQAKALAGNKARRVVVEGHTDERGGREYNLALGQKRAEAVLKSLGLLGVGAGQVEAVSFGEERPAAQGSDEAAWARNRRAEMKDR